MKALLKISGIVMGATKISACCLMLAIILYTQIAMGQLITMDNKCTKLVAQGNAANNARNYQEGFQIFNQVLQECKARDAKNKGNGGLAMALNGLGRYQEALNAANLCLKFSKNRNVTGWYARGMAKRGMGDEAGAKADLAKVVEMTNKNRSQNDRALVYAEIADLDMQSGRPADAFNNISTAIQMNGNNPDFYIQRGDIHFYEGRYEDAFADYDQAVKLGRSDMAMYELRTSMRLKQYEKKYNTNEVNELANKLSADEKQKLCAELKEALRLGLKNMNLDLLALKICK